MIRGGVVDDRALVVDHGDQSLAAYLLDLAAVVVGDDDGLDLAGEAYGRARGDGPFVEYGAR